MKYEVRARARGDKAKQTPPAASEGPELPSETCRDCDTFTRAPESSAEPPALTRVNAASDAKYSATPRRGSDRGCARATTWTSAGWSRSAAREPGMSQSPFVIFRQACIADLSRATLTTFAAN